MTDLINSTQEETYTALGLTPPEAEEKVEEVNEETQEVVEPVESESVDSQEVAEPEQETEDSGEETKRDLEEDSKFAAARRKAEEKADKEIAAIKQKADEEKQAEIDAFIAQQGYINPLTNKPITTKKEYDEYAEAEATQKLDEGELSAAAINTLIEKNNRIQAEKVEAQRKAQQESEEQIKKDTDARAAYELQVLEIGNKYDPSIKEAKDLLDKPYTEELREKLNRGYSLVDAFKIVNEADIAKRQAERATNAVSKNTQGKSHLTPPSSKGGQNDALVPSAEMAMFKSLLPKATDAEIQKYYNKTIAQKKGG